jgi:hypothetical protein
MSAIITWILANPRAAATYALIGLLTIALGVSRLQLVGAHADAASARASLTDMTTQRDVAVRLARQNAELVERVTNDKADSDRRLALASAELVQAAADRARTVTTIREEIDHAVTPTDCAPSAALRAAHAGARRLLDAARH